MRSPPFSSRLSRYPCHCEPVRTLVWQSVSHPRVIPTKAQPRGGIFALKVCKAESKCEDSSTPLRSARNDTELALRRVGNGFIRSAEECINAFPTSKRRSGSCVSPCLCYWCRLLLTNQDGSTKLNIEGQGDPPQPGRICLTYASQGNG